MSNKITSAVGKLYDRVYCEAHLAYLEKGVTTLACIGFVAHILVIFIARQFESPDYSALSELDHNYLHAVYTPFSVLLFYEVLLLVLALPKSLTSSIGKQYEIISLIVIRSVFKDIGKFRDLQHWTDQSSASLAVVLDMSAAAAMFLLVTVFYHVRRRGVASGMTQKVEGFIALKKSVAFVLSFTLIGLAAYSLASWSIAAGRSLAGAEYTFDDLDLIFFPQFYEVMIFTDVFLLIASFSISDRFEYVFRNAGFVISTVLLRFSLTAPKPYDVVVPLIAMAFGLLVLAIFNYFRYVSRISKTPAIET